MSKAGNQLHTPRPALRIGVFGGSFDPIHTAHLIMAESVREELQLDRVLFVPAGDQPLKEGTGAAPVEHRVEMVRLAIQGNPYFTLSRVDVDRTGPSYTVDTMRQLGKEWEVPERASLWFIIGADSLLTFPRWRDPEGILEQARLAVVRRPGYEPDTDELFTQLPRLAGSVDWVDAPLIDISATDIRRRIRDGNSVRYLLPNSVWKHIEAHMLYR